MLRPTWNAWNTTPWALDESLSELIQFRDVSAVKMAHLSRLDRSGTLRTTAPSLLAEPLEQTSLRPAARWPNTLAVVRSRTEVERIPNASPELISLVKQLVLARQPIVKPMTQSREVVAEALELAVVEVAAEKANSVANSAIVKQSVESSFKERTQPQPATVTSAELKVPQSRPAVISVVANTATVSAIGPAQPVVRAGSTLRTNDAAKLSADERSLPASALAAIESPLSPSPIVMNRAPASAVGTVPGLIGQQALPNSTVAAHPNLLIAVEPTTAVATSNKNLLPTSSARQVSEPKPVTLIDEPSAQISRPTETQFVVAPLPTVIVRAETSGPFPESSSQAVAVERRAFARARFEDNVVAANLSASPVNAAATTVNPIVRRDTQRPAIADSKDAEELLKTKDGGPALLLTSATQLVELLPASILTALVKTQLTGPQPTLSESNDGRLAKWLPQLISSATFLESRAAANLLPVAGSPTVVLPRQVKDSSAAGIVEEIKPIDP